jgi:alkanesulfonate monooxygenase SsuD/methylene tetrahydromethanopterin reductase-like flavin-dependent oxidoreductase (luciferase family)
MNARQFRFGVAGSPTTGEEWVKTVRQAADLGFQTVLMPDGLQLPAPFSSLAMAAAVADIRVGTFVAAAPLRTPRQTAWEAHTLTVLTDGRFEFGIGTGRLLLRGTPQEMADELLRRRDQIGASYISVNSGYLEDFAPVIELLDGK